MKESAVFLILCLAPLRRAAAAAAEAAPAAVSVSIPSLGLWQSFKQSAASLMPGMPGFAPALNFAPQRDAPPALPPSFLPQNGNAARSLPSADPAAGPSVNPGGSAAAGALGQPVLPGGIIPLRASQSNPSTIFFHRKLSLDAKAKALRAPLQNLADLRVGGASSAERASRSGRMIADIVSDDFSGAGAAAQPGLDQAPAAEQGALRDAVAQPSGPQSSAPRPEAFASGRRIASGASGHAFAASGAIDEAVDAAVTFSGQSRGGLSMRIKPEFSARETRLDPSLLILHVVDNALSFTVAGKDWLADHLRWDMLFSAAASPKLQAGANSRLAPPAQPPIYALGAHGPSVSGDAGERASESAGALSRSDRAAVLESPDAAALPRSLPYALAYGMLLPFLGVVLFYLREFRR